MSSHFSVYISPTPLGCEVYAQVALHRQCRLRFLQVTPVRVGNRGRPVFYSLINGLIICFFSRCLETFFSCDSWKMSYWGSHIVFGLRSGKIVARQLRYLHDPEQDGKKRIRVSDVHSSSHRIYVKPLE